MEERPESLLQLCFRHHIFLHSIGGAALRAGLPGFSTGCRKYKLPVLNTLRCDQPVGDLSYFVGFSAQDQYFQAQMPAQVDMHSRNDFI